MTQMISYLKRSDGIKKCEEIILDQFSGLQIWYAKLAGSTNVHERNPNIQPAASRKLDVIS